MRAPRPQTIAVAVLVAAALSVAMSPTYAGMGMAMPFTYVYDTGSSSKAPLSPAQMADTSAWTQLPEKKLDHAFKGDVVLFKNNMMLVVRTGAAGAEVYSPAKSGPRLRLLVSCQHGAGRV